MAEIEGSKITDITGGDTDTDRAEWFRKIHDLKDDYKAVKETGWNRIFGRSIHG